MDHAVDGFVYGSIAAGYQDQIRAAINCAACDLTRMARSTCSNRIHADAVRVQQLDWTPKDMVSPSEPACVWIVYEYGLPVAIDSTLIIIDARG